MPIGVLVKSGLFVVLMLVSIPLLALEGAITAIHFEGNEKTRDSILIQELSIAPGDPYNAKALERSRQALMNLGLFRDVTVKPLQGPEGVSVTFRVEEKYFLLAFPRLDADPEGDYDYGLEARFDNLLGLNQSLRLIYLNHRTIHDDDYLLKETSLNYNYPRILGSPYQLGVSFKHAEQDLELGEGGVEDAVYRNDSLTNKLSLWRWLDARGPSRGWRVGGHLTWQKERYTYLSGRHYPYRNSRAVSTSAFLEYYDVQEHKYYRSGQTYGFVTELGLADLDSDYNYNRNMLYWRRYQPLDIVQRSNFNTQIRLGWALGERFGSKAFAIGSANTLRGYEADYDTGNGTLLMNLEYYYHLSGYPQLRALVFTDLGNVYDEAEQIDLGELRSSAGLGLRWRVQSFVNVTLSLDYAYAFETDDYVVYANTRGSF